MVENLRKKRWITSSHERDNYIIILNLFLDWNWINFPFLRRVSVLKAPAGESLSACFTSSFQFLDYLPSSLKKIITRFFLSYKDIIQLFYAFLNRAFSLDIHDFSRMFHDFCLGVRIRDLS